MAIASYWTILFTTVLDTGADADADADELALMTQLKRNTQVLGAGVQTLFITFLLSDL